VDYLGLIRTTADQMETIIGELRSAVQHRPSERSRIAVSAIVDQALARLSPAPSIHIRRDIKPDLPAIEVDSRQVIRVLANIILNAVEAMPQGGTLTFLADVEGNEVVLAVADTGIGITAEHRGRLFEPFFTTKPEGIGLGLLLARQTLEADFGRIDFSGEPGKGTTFRLHFPAAPASDGAGPAE
jgi:signal transduction histidine kinase